MNAPASNRFYRTPDAEPYGRLLKPAEVAKILHVSPSTVAAWRLRGSGPPYLKVVGTIRYPEAALRQWLAAKVSQR